MFQIITIKIVYFVFGVFFAESNWQFISICSFNIGGYLLEILSIHGSVVSV